MKFIKKSPNKKSYLKWIIRKCLSPIETQVFLYLFLINIISNLSSLKYQCSFLSAVEIVSLSAFIGYFESAIYCFLPHKQVQKVYTACIVVLHSLLAVVEYFILINFNKNINQDVIDILAETNTKESTEFLDTYLSFSSVAFYLIVASLVSVILYYFTKWLSRNVKYVYVCFALVLLGVITLGYSAYGFILYRDGKSIPQLTTITRGGYALYIMNRNMKQIDNVIIACKNITVTQQTKKKPSIVVIIGESHSLQHSSLYGYRKCTNPLLGKLKDDGSLLAFDDAVCVETFTTASLKADYSLDSLGVNYESTVLFPACFKKAGYHTALFDNQYFAGQGVNFISNSELSKVLFDERNTKRYEYDEDMIKDIIVRNTPSLYVIHLWGQHYTYTDRYPSAFERFKQDQYNNKYTESERLKMAEYDNACLYNDYVINSIIEKFRNQYCCIFYFSDHGEEIYEIRNFMGHGDGESSPDIRYQTNIPLLVWMSEEYAKENQYRFHQAIHYPISMDDIGHAIIDAAGIRCKDFVESRSFINRHYNKNRKRIVMHSMDYDKKTKEQLHLVYE